MRAPFVGIPAILIAIASALLLSACTAPLSGPLKLTAADSGSTQTLAVGQKMLVALDSNPSTGYHWAIDGALPPQLVQVGEPAYSASSNAIGAGGVEVWTFSAKSAGQGTLKMKYWRSFEPTATPPQTFQVTIDAK